MDCIILLLLLGCCGGWGNSNRSGNSGGCGCASERNYGYREGNMGQPRRGGFGGRDASNGGDMPRMPFRENQEKVSEGCSCGQSNDNDCDGPGMIPPPWQDYPQFPRRNGSEDCECES